MQIGQRNVPTIACPLCSEQQDIIVDGHAPHPTEHGQVIFEKGKGFAFCNCRNIFFGDWKNIEQAVYDEKYTEKYQGDVTNNYFKQYFRVYYPFIRRFKSSGRVCEIGCVNKTLLDCFKAAGYETYALDIIPHQWEGHVNITTDFEKYRTDEKFAIVWASHVFEHFKDPIAAFKTTYEILESGGLAFIAMPDPYFIDWKAPYSWGHWHFREHHVMWDLHSLCELLEEIGFEVLDKIHNTGSSFICNGDFHVIARKK